MVLTSCLACGILLAVDLLPVMANPTMQSAGDPTGECTVIADDQVLLGPTPLEILVSNANQSIPTAPLPLSPAGHPCAMVFRIDHAGYTVQKVGLIWLRVSADLNKSYANAALALGSYTVTVAGKPRTDARVEVNASDIGWHVCIAVSVAVPGRYGDVETRILQCFTPTLDNATAAPSTTPTASSTVLTIDNENRGSDVDREVNSTASTAAPDAQATEIKPSSSSTSADVVAAIVVPSVVFLLLVFVVVVLVRACSQSSTGSYGMTQSKATQPSGALASGGITQ